MTNHFWYEFSEFSFDEVYFSCFLYLSDRQISKFSVRNKNTSGLKFSISVYYNLLCFTLKQINTVVVLKHQIIVTNSNIF